MDKAEGGKKASFREVFASAKKRKLQEIQKELMGSQEMRDLTALRKKTTDKKSRDEHDAKENGQAQDGNDDGVDGDGANACTGIDLRNNDQGKDVDRASDRSDKDQEEDSDESELSDEDEDSNDDDRVDDDAEEEDDDEAEKSSQIQSQSKRVKNQKNQKSKQPATNGEDKRQALHENDEETDDDSLDRNIQRTESTSHPKKKRPLMIVTPVRSKSTSKSTQPKKPSKKARTPAPLMIGSALPTQDKSPKTPGSGSISAELSVKMPEFYETRAFSNVKDYFVPVSTPEGILDNAHVQCTICKLLIGNRNYSLKRHLYRHHREVFQLERVGLSQKEEEEGEDNRTQMPLENEQAPDEKHVKTETSEKFRIQITSRSSMTPCSDDRKPKRRKIVDEETLRINTALLAWIRSDCVPLKALENRLFGNFISKLNGSYKLPELVVQRFNGESSVSDTLRESLDASSVVGGKMRGFVLKGNGTKPQLEQELERPIANNGEALIRVLRSGICATDLELVRGYKHNFSGVLGHEFVGIVEYVHPSCPKEEAAKWIGQRVVGEINITCNNADGNCAVCQVGSCPDATLEQQCRRRNHCPKRRCLGIVAKDGCLAEYITLPLTNLFPVPDSLMDSHAVFAEPIAAACRIFEQSLIEPGDRVAVVGDGKLGLLIVEVIQAYDLMNQVVLIGKHKRKMALAGKHVEQMEYNSSLGSALQEKFDVCIECTGAAPALQFASQIVRRKGRLVVKTTCSQNKNAIDSVALGAKQVQVVGTRCGSFERALELLTSRKVDAQKFIEAAYPLSQVESAFDHAARRGTLKIQVVMLP